MFHGFDASLLCFLHLLEIWQSSFQLLPLLGDDILRRPFIAKPIAKFYNLEMAAGSWASRAIVYNFVFLSSESCAMTPKPVIFPDFVMSVIISGAESR